LKLAAAIALAACLTSQADSLFTWPDATNKVPGSATTVWQGNAATGNYATPYLSMSNSLAFSDGWLKDGVNYFAFTQICTNKQGKQVITPFSGEVQVWKIPSATLNVLTSSDLGVNWSIQSSVTFPTTEAQRFWKLQMIKINAVKYSASP